MSSLPVVGNGNVQTLTPGQPATPPHSHKDILTQRLATFDPELNLLISKEQRRQNDTISLIASENVTPEFVSDALSSCLSAKYSEGYPYKRYYEGNEFIDQIEELCQKRALETFNLDKKVWSVNVQPLSGSPANLAVYFALLKPGDKILGMSLSHGGHLTHGHQVVKKGVSNESEESASSQNDDETAYKYGKITASATFFIPVAYQTKDGVIDYDDVERLAALHKPKIIIAGASAYSKQIDYKRFREIADKHGAILMADMAHISGLVAANLLPSPFDFCDIVTTTTHKTLRGPRGALIFFKNVITNPLTRTVIKPRINSAVFPGLQGGPHNHTIAAIATALKAAKSPEFREYQKSTIQNNKTMADVLTSPKYKFDSKITLNPDNHLILLELGHEKRWKDAAKKLAEVNIVVNSNQIPNDSAPRTSFGHSINDSMAPSKYGLRIGTPAMTSRGMGTEEAKELAELIGGYLTDRLTKEEVLSRVKALTTKFPNPRIDWTKRSM